MQNTMKKNKEYQYIKQLAQPFQHIPLKSKMNKKYNLKTLNFHQLSVITLNNDHSVIFECIYFYIPSIFKYLLNFSMRTSKSLDFFRCFILCIKIN